MRALYAHVLLCPLSPVRAQHVAVSLHVLNSSAWLAVKTQT